MKAIIDNDIIFKGLKGDLLLFLIRSIPGETEVVGALGASPYVLNGLIRKCDEPLRESLNSRLALFLQNSNLLEPTQDELLLAADFERTAQEVGLLFDVGESQICSMAILRAIPFVATGDKRAIESLEELFDRHLKIASLTNRVFCLEQLVLRALTPECAATLRNGICAGGKIDMTLSICFACHSDNVDVKSIAECLNSYISHLREKAPRILAA